MGPQATGEQPRLEVWNRRIDIEAYLQDVGHQPFRRHLLSVSERARHRDSRQAVAKLCQADGAGVLQIRHDPPLIWRHAEMEPKPGERPLQERVHQIDASYKAVGVGAVGTRCSIGLLLGPRPDDVLVLQSKQAEASVYEPYATSPAPSHQGQRVVEGQRLMQTVSDPFLGWTTNAHGEHLYWRHFRDWKGSVELAALDAKGLESYGELCSLALSKAHARSGDRVAIAAFIGDGACFDKAMVAYGLAYQQQGLCDFEPLHPALSGDCFAGSMARIHATFVLDVRQTPSLGMGVWLPKVEISGRWPTGPSEDSTMGACLSNAMKDRFSFGITPICWCTAR
ncbi:DUF2252 domain-containing protein [Synechococcus sp. FGCU-3]|nr:DUF2252 domain-containing protein [Synechococcus sp. FGCU3]